MSKKKQHSEAFGLPPIDSLPLTGMNPGDCCSCGAEDPPQTTETGESIAPEPRAEGESPPPYRVMLSVPVAVKLAANGYRSRHVDARLTVAQSEALSRIVAGLDRADARMANGRHVTTAADALRWLLDEIGEAPRG